MEPSQTVTLQTYTVCLTIISSILSLVGAGTIFASYILIKKSQNFTRHLLLYLTIADTLTAVGNLVASGRYIHIHSDDVLAVNVTKACNGNATTEMETVCVVQSFVTTSSNMASYFWTFIIAVHICWSVVMKSDVTQRRCMLVFYHVVSWLIPIAIVTVVFSNGYLGEDTCYGTGVWCGIRSDLPPHIITTWMYVADIAWQLACYVIVCAMYVSLKFYLSRKGRMQLHNINASLRDEDKNFLYVSLILYALKSWGLLRFFLSTYVPDGYIESHRAFKTFLEVLLNIQSYGASGQAFWNSILFCACDETVRTGFCRMIRKRGGETLGASDEEKVPLYTDNTSRLNFTQSFRKQQSLVL